MSDWSFVDSDPLWERLRKREKREEFRADLEATWWNPPILSMPNHPRYTSQGIHAQLEDQRPLGKRVYDAVVGPRTKEDALNPNITINPDKKPRTFMERCGDRGEG